MSATAPYSKTHPASVATTFSLPTIIAHIEQSAGVAALGSKQLRRLATEIASEAVALGVPSIDRSHPNFVEACRETIDDDDRRHAVIYLLAKLQNSEGFTDGLRVRFLAALDSIVAAATEVAALDAKRLGIEAPSSSPKGHRDPNAGASPSGGLSFPPPPPNPSTATAPAAAAASATAPEAAEGPASMDLQRIETLLELEDRNLWLRFSGDGGRWYAFDFAEEPTVLYLLAKLRLAMEDEDEPPTAHITIRGVPYEVDVVKMTQRNLETNRVRALQLVPIDDATRRSLRLEANVLELYHQTSHKAAEAIIASQTMKCGTSGLAGGGIYFATSPEHTDHKAVHKGVILKAKVLLGRIKALPASGDSTITGERLAADGFDSVLVNRVNGVEYVVYFPDQVRAISVHERFAEDKAITEVPLLSLPKFAELPKRFFLQAAPNEKWVEDITPDKQPSPGPTTTTRKPNAWVEFCKANKGRGWTRQQMSEEYWKHKAATAGGKLGRGGVSPSDSNRSNVATAPQPGSATRAPNPWNEFQKAHAGQGLSRADMSSMYQAEKAKAASTQFNATTGAGESSASAASLLRSLHAERQQREEVGSSTRAPNPWNEFQKAHAGLGLSASQMSALYQAQKSGSDSGRAGQPTSSAERIAAESQQLRRQQEEASRRAAESTAAAERERAERAERTRQQEVAAAARRLTESARSYEQQSYTTPSVAPSRTTNPWNEFQRAHAGQGLSRSEMSAQYQAQKAQPARDPFYTAPSSYTSPQYAATPSSYSSGGGGGGGATRAPNSWNEFQKAHAGQGLSRSEMSAMYQAQKGGR